MRAWTISRANVAKLRAHTLRRVRPIEDVVVGLSRGAGYAPAFADPEGNLRVDPGAHAPRHRSV